MKDGAYIYVQLSAILTEIWFDFSYPDKGNESKVRVLLQQYGGG